MEKLNGSEIRRWVWGGGPQPIEERDPSNVVAKRFYAGLGEQVAGTAYFYTFDHLGSIRELTDGTGTVRARYNYTPYGERTKLSGDLDATFGFTGYLYHSASGLNLTIYRAYDAQLGRWLSRDPIEERGGLNLYAYAANSPINFVDPYGDVAFLPILLIIWAIAEIGLSAYDIVDTASTLIDPCESNSTKAASTVGLVVGMFSPGGGYGVAGKNIAKGAKNEVTVYRVFGGDARAQGFSWTTTDPRTVKNFRDAAGLPSGGASGATNTADFLVQGKVNPADIIKSRSALPLDGNKGGLPELIIDPKNVNLTDFSVLNP
jgi:RHS repeat-associated protein